MKKVTKNAGIEAQRELHEIDKNIPSTILLSSGKKLKIGWIKPCTQDKIDDIYTAYHNNKKESNKTETELNGETRRFFAKTSAAIIINSYIGIKLFWWIKWRMLYYYSKYSADDYFNVILEGKKKARQEMYLLSMALLTEMVGTWTMMTKKEAEEYRAELESARKQHSQKSSHIQVMIGLSLALDSQNMPIMKLLWQNQM